MNEHEVNGNLRCEVQELTVQVAVLESRLAASNEALKLQAKEYARRLEELNHAHERAENVLKGYGSTYLTVDRFDRFYNGEHMEWRRAVDAKLTKIESMNAYYLGALAIFLAVITLAVQFWHIWKA